MKTPAIVATLALLTGLNTRATAAIITASATVAERQPAPAPTALTFVPASATAFGFEGRFDLTKTDAPVVVWQGSRIHLEFESDTLELRFADVKGQNFFNAELDGHTTVIELREGAPPHGVRFDGLGNGRHRLTLFKRSEAAAGTVRFLGANLAPGAKPFPAVIPRRSLALQFFGDSITAGACNEDGAVDQWEDRRTHNNALSYAALTASALQADYRNISVSGMGVALGWTEMKAYEIWDRVYPDPASPRADLTTWIPDVICVNLGENDDSFATSNRLPFPAIAYADGLVNLITSIRAAYPSTHIVLLRGGMFGGARSEALRPAWEGAVTRLKAGDQKFAAFVFKHWSSNHPRVSDHRAMADELTSWLRDQDFIQARARR